MYDLAVIGAGPAGAAAAWTAARRGLHVILLERGEYPRDKVCGEFFSAEALPLLEQIAPHLPADAPVIASAVFISAAGARHGFRLPTAARGISRLALDAALWQAAREAGVECVRAAVTQVQSAAAGFTLQTDRGEPVSARSLIVAAGRWWRIPGLADPPVSRSPWIGVKARFQGLSESTAIEMFCFRGGYCGLAPVEAGWMNACCLVRRQHAGALAGSRDFAAWIAPIAGAPLQERLRGGRQATATVTTAPVELGPRTAMVQAALLVGDASGFIDPFTGDGMARALLSGELAATCIADGQPERYPAALARAAGASYRASRGLRAVLAAPGWAQAAALFALARPGCGPWLVRRTRWTAAS